jgi:hypothetical protein
MRAEINGSTAFDMSSGRMASAEIPVHARPITQLRIGADFATAQAFIQHTSESSFSFFWTEVKTEIDCDAN